MIQGVSPTSGASFVKRGEQTELLQKMMEAGDLREHIPSVWRGKVKQFALERGEWSPKEGEAIDADGQIRELLGRFRSGEEKKPKEEELADALKEYLASDRQESDREKLRNILYAYAGFQDALREKIDRIQGVDYGALELLDQLFRDKDNLSVMLRDALRKVPMELLLGKGKKQAKRKLEGDVAGLVKRLRQTWGNTSVPEAKRITILSKLLETYEEADIRKKILERADVRETPLAQAIATVLKEGPALSEQEIGAEILSEPLQIIEKEKAKFEYKAGRPMRIGLRAVKGPAYGMYGLSSGVCTATDIALWKKKEFKLFAIVDEEVKQIVGYIHAFEAKDKKGNRILTLPGINPSAEFMGFVDTEKFYDGLMEQVIAYAKEGGFAGVVLPTAPNIHSNRSGIQKVIQSKGYTPVKIPQANWNTLPNPYPFEEVFPVWQEAPGKK